MKILKKVIKIVVLLFLALVLGLTALDIYMIKKPEQNAKKKIDGIEESARQVEELTINEKATVIGLGEATHGNAEFQELKLDVLKVLAGKYDVSCFAMEMDYGEGVIINDYINGCSGMTIDEVMDHISFTIYRTEEIRGLIEWMREYNEQHDDRLSFYGFDLQNPDVDLALIRDFVNKNSIGGDPAAAFEPFVNGEVSLRDESLNHAFEELESLRSELTSNKETYRNLYNYDRILECIENVFRARELSFKYAGDNGTVEGGGYRDQLMAKKVIEISETSGNSRMMITGHNGHIGYAGNFAKTMGAFIRDELDDAYFAIGTDYFITKCSMPDSSGKRADHRFVSADILAYQAKDLGTYYLDFSRVDKDSDVYRYINKPIYTGSLGEGYSILNTILQDTVRLYCEPDYLYDAMIFVYECTPLNLLAE